MIDKTEPKYKKILIIDDDDSIAEFLKFSLENEEFRTDCASDGLIGLQKVENFEPDLILLDMMMPKKAGFEVVKSLQKPEYVKIPIIIITGKLLNDTIQSMLKTEPNVKECMIKPPKIEILLSKIHSLLGTISKYEKNAIDKGKELKGDIDPWKINI